MLGPLLDEKILAIQGAFDASSIPHAFGGALALAYYATPRGTEDIDVNVFVGTERAAAVLEALDRLGVATGDPTDLSKLREHGQVRLHWDRTPVDLFFAYDPLHEACVGRRKRVPFGGDDRIFILSAEDLVIFKVLFDRPKDWTDIGEMLFALGGEFDAEYTLDWLRRILSADDQRLRRFEEDLSSG